MVGTPVAIISGWTLYKREVLGEDPRPLVKPEEGVEDTVPEADGKEGGRKASIF